MKVFTDFLNGMDNLDHRSRTEEILNWVHRKYPDLATEIKWNQPMFIDHDTFIISFSTAKNHLAVAPEKKGIDHFSDEITKSGYEYSKMLIRIPWNQPVDYSLLEKIIDFNIEDKAGSTTFWRP